jgi:hypothetical protein
VSANHIRISNRAVFKEVETYQTLEIMLRWRGNHPQEATSGFSLLNLFLGESVLVLVLAGSFFYVPLHLKTLV